MPLYHWSIPFRWLCWWSQQTLRWWEYPRQMPPIQPRKLMRVCIIPGWSMTLVQCRGSFHWTRHAVWYNRRSTVMWVCCIPKLLRALSRFTVSGRAGGESITGPNTTSVLGFWAEPATMRSCWALKPAHSTSPRFPWICDSHAASRCWLNMTAADWSCDSSADRAFVGRHSGIGRQWTTYNRSIEVFFPDFRSPLTLTLTPYPKITPEMDSSFWKTLKKRHYTTLYVIEITSWKLAEIQDGRDSRLEFWEMLKVAQIATKLTIYNTFP